MNEKEYYETVISEEEFVGIREQDHPTYENPSVTAGYGGLLCGGALEASRSAGNPPPVSIGSPWLGGFLQSTRRCYPG